MYPLVRNSAASGHLRSLLANLNTSECKQVEGLLLEIKSITAANEKYKNSLQESERESREALKQIANLKLEINSKMADNDIIKKENLDQKKLIDYLNIQIHTMQMDEIRLRGELDNYKKHEKEYEQLKRLKRIMSENSQEIVNYKNELEGNMTPPEEMAKVFFEMVMIKNL